MEQHYEQWLEAYQTQDKEKMREVQVLTSQWHKQKCGCAMNGVINVYLLKAYTKMGLYLQD